MLVVAGGHLSPWERLLCVQHRAEEPVCFHRLDSQTTAGGQGVYSSKHYHNAWLDAHLVRLQVMIFLKLFICRLLIYRLND